MDCEYHACDAHQECGKYAFGLRQDLQRLLL